MAEKNTVPLFKRTKIVCTFGPSTDAEDTLKQLIQSGMNIARLNLSHGDSSVQLPRLEAVRRISAELGEHVGVMFDTRGPDVRVGGMQNDAVELKTGAEFILTSEPAIGDQNRASVSFDGLTSILSKGDSVFLADGLILLEVTGTRKEDVTCRVVSGGVLKSRKGVNCPGKVIPLPVLTENDIADLKAGAKAGIDFIAASFVRSASDIERIKGVISPYRIPVISKIECVKGLENLEEIIDASDGIMVARGDLGVEIPPEEVPGVQKKIIRMCLAAGIPVITATEMLESMTHNPRPTRAEVADVANAVLDGTSAVMLSGETAVGDYPVEAVKMMSRACRAAEISQKSRMTHEYQKSGIVSVRNGIAHAACHLACEADASAIICVTDSGRTAEVLSNDRILQPVIACTPSDVVARRLSMYWGIIPLIVEGQESVETLLKIAVDAGRRKALIKPGDRIVFTGNLTGRGGETNLLACVDVN